MRASRLAAPGTKSREKTVAGPESLLKGRDTVCVRLPLTPVLLTGGAPSPLDDPNRLYLRTLFAVSNVQKQPSAFQPDTTANWELYPTNGPTRFDARPSFSSLLQGSSQLPGGN